MTLINREDAIDELRRLIPYKKYHRGEWVHLLEKKEVFKALKSLPSADAEWIPCSDRLPKDSGEYLVRPSDGVIEDYSDFSEVMIMPYDAECEAFGWWIDRYDPISLGFVDSDFNEFEVIAWMPLPKPWKGADDE